MANDLTTLPAAGTMAAPDGLTPQPLAGLGKLAAALAEAQKRCKPVEHDRRNEHHRYDYTSSEAIIEAARQALADTGLALLTNSPRLTTVGSGASTQFILTRNVGLLHTSGESCLFDPIEWPVIPGNGRPLDKAFAGAITSSLGYFLRDLLLMARVAEGDDISARDDRDHQQKGKPPAAKPAPAAAQRTAPAPVAPAARPVFTAAQLKGLRSFLDEHAWDAAKLLPYVGVNRLEDVPADLLAVVCLAVETGTDFLKVLNVQPGAAVLTDLDAAGIGTAIKRLRATKKQLAAARAAEPAKG